MRLESGASPRATLRALHVSPEPGELLAEISRSLDPVEHAQWPEQTHLAALVLDVRSVHHELSSLHGLEQVVASDRGQSPPHEDQLGQRVERGELPDTVHQHNIGLRCALGAQPHAGFLTPEHAQHARHPLEVAGDQHEAQVRSVALAQSSPRLEQRFLLPRMGAARDEERALTDGRAQLV